MTTGLPRCHFVNDVANNCLQAYSTNLLQAAATYHSSSFQNNKAPHLGYRPKTRTQSTKSQPTNHVPKVEGGWRKIDVSNLERKVVELSKTYVNSHDGTRYLLCPSHCLGVYELPLS